MKIFLNILWIVAVLIWALFFAFGFNYCHPSNLAVIILIFVAAAAFIGVDLFLLNYFADRDKQSNAYTAKIKEYAALIVFGLLVIVSVYFVAHFINMQTSVRSEVQPLAEERVMQVETLFGDESKPGSYAQYVAKMSEQYGKENAQNFDGGSIDTFVGLMQDELYGEDNKTYDNLKDQCGSLSDANSQLYKWDYAILNWTWVPWEVNDALKDLQDNSTKWAQALQDLSANTPWIKDNGYEVYHPQMSNNDFYSLFENPTSSNWGFLSIIIILLLLLMMIFPYIKEKDWSRRGPEGYKGGQTW